MATIRVFQAVNRNAKTDKHSIFLTFYTNREKVQIPCKLSVPLSAFDEKEGKVNKSHPDHKDYNLIIENLRAKISDILVRYRLRGITLTKELFLKEFRRPTDMPTFFDYYVHYKRTHRNELEYSTIQTHNVVIDKLRIYNPKLHCEDITEDFVNQYKAYLKRKLENRESTITKNLSVIKKYVRAAIKDGYMTKDPFENIKILRNVKTQRSFLVESELMDLFHLYRDRKISGTHYQVLEFFLFMCFSSLHIGDAKNINIEQLGKQSFIYYRKKLRNKKPEPIVIPYSEPLKMIMHRAAEDRNKGLLFPHLIADQKINENIKQICRIHLGIERPISCKSARHTYATIFLRNTNDLPTLREILGHTDYRETLIYAHVLEESKIEKAAIFNKFI